MGIRTGRQLLPLATALLLTLAACAQPAAAPSAVASPNPLLTITVQPTATAQSRSTTTAATTTAATTTAATAAVTSGAGEVVPPLPSCSAATLHTSVRGTLTFVVSDRAGAPWIIGAPARGRGFEAAVGAAVAQQLGFAADRVAWKTATPADIQAAKVVGADVGVGEFRTPDQAGGPVDYSTGYFSISDSVVARTGTPAARATALAALATLRVASLRDTTAARADFESPATTRYPTAAAALGALRSGSVDVAVVPTPAAVTAGAEVTVVGQLSLPTEQPAQFGMVLAKNSPLTSCVSAAIDQLRITGALAALVQRWIPAANKPLR